MSHKGNEAASWPLIGKAVALEMLSPVDYAFARTLLKDYPDCEEGAAAFLCLLAAASRNGHLCVHVGAQGMQPSPEALGIENGDQEVMDMLLSSHKFLSKLPKALVATVGAEAAELPFKPLFRCGGSVYFQKNYLFESRFLSELNRLLAAKPRLQLDSAAVGASVDRMVNEGTLNALQAAAVRNFSAHALSIICGGPGTGKTYTAGRLIRLFLELMPQDGGANCKIALAAPTGKAASNLQKSLKSAFQASSASLQVEAKTLHALLGLKGCSNFYSKPRKLDADLIVVDECSMIDAQLMGALLSSIRDGTRLIMLGDPYQLPPVESGALFTDLVQLFSQDMLMRRHLTLLKQCLRAELQELVDCAEQVKTGSFFSLKAKMSAPPVQWINFTEEKRELRKLKEKLIGQYASQFPAPGIKDLSPDELMQSFNRFRILSPLRKGPLGVEELNAGCFKHFITARQSAAPCAVPIMIVSNDYHLALFNGETGVLVTKGKDLGNFDAADVAYFPTEAGGYRAVPAVLLPRFELAYALSVHKSQGSEFDRVLLLLPHGAEVFGREVLYTAVTRAKKELTLWAPEEVLKQTLSRHSQRISGIEARQKFNFRE